MDRALPTEAWQEAPDYTQWREWQRPSVKYRETGTVPGTEGSKTDKTAHLLTNEILLFPSSFLMLPEL